MKCAAVFLIFLAPVTLAARQGDAELNVNSRYTVESVEVVPRQFARLSTRLQKDMQKLVGEKLDTDALQDLRIRIQHEVRTSPVVERIVRGTQPAHVRVIYEVGRKERDFRLALPRLAYYSGQGWSGGLDGELRLGNNLFAGGVVSNGDDLIERFSGVHARYERQSLGTDRLAFRFIFEDYHEQWNNSTNAAQAVASSGARLPDLYEDRRNLEPALEVKLARPLTFAAGVSFETMDTEVPAAKSETSSAVKTTLRLIQHWEDSEFPSSLEAGYELHAATRSLGSDLVYNRQTVYANYTVSHGPHHVRLGVFGGSIHGRAPAFERFVLGNSQSLRGWSKYDITPLGTDRVVQGTAEYAYGPMTVFYDAGSAWNRGAAGDVHDAVGAGLRWRAFFLAAGFPLRNGSISPILMMTVEL